MHRTQIYLPQNHLAYLRKVAQKKDTTVSEIIRTILDKCLLQKFLTQKEDNLTHCPSLFDALKKINALGQKGPPDLAKNMDKYLYEDIK